MALVAFPAAAISRYNSQSMSCVRVQSIIRNEGAAIMRYPSKYRPGVTLFDRYVVDERFCTSDKYAQMVTIPTADNPNCRVFRCQQRTGEGPDHGGHFRMR